MHTVVPHVKAIYHMVIWTRDLVLGSRQILIGLFGLFLGLCYLSSCPLVLVSMSFGDFSEPALQ